MSRAETLEQAQATGPNTALHIEKTYSATPSPRTALSTGVRGLGKATEANFDSRQVHSRVHGIRILFSQRSQPGCHMSVCVPAIEPAAPRGLTMSTAFSCPGKPDHFHFRRATMSSPLLSDLRTFEFLSPAVAAITAQSPHGCHCPSVCPSAPLPCQLQEGSLLASPVRHL